MRTVLFLGASVSQVAAMRQARASGLVVLVVDGDRDAVGFAEADGGEAIDFSDVGRVTAFARRAGVDAVVAVSTDRAVPVAAAVAESLGLPGVGIETALVMTDKGAMRDRLAGAGVAQPRFRVLDGSIELGEALEAVGLPAVLKPADSGGQRGVFQVMSVDQLQKRLPLSLAHSRAGKAILESYIEGDELNGIVVVRSGKPTLVTLSDRLRPKGAGFGVGWIHLFPSHLESAALQTAAAVAVEAVRALGLQDGIAFPQLLVSQAGGVYVVEAAARVPAGQMADLVKFGTGVDLVRIALAQALGDPITDEMVQPKFQRPLAIYFFTASPGILPVGRVTSISGIEAVRSSAGVLAADLYFRPGETIHPVEVDADRRGYVIAAGESSDDALRLARAAAEKLRVTVEATNQTDGPAGRVGDLAG